LKKYHKFRRKKAKILPDVKYPPAR